MTLLASAPSADYSIRLFDEIGLCDYAVLVRELEEVTRDQVGVGASELLAQKFVALSEGRGVYCVIDTMHPVGWFGWLAESARFLESDTFVAPSLWGVGANTALKSLQYQIATELGVGLLSAVAVDNWRSQGAMRKLWPRVAPRGEWSDRRQRYELVWRLSTPPVGYLPWHDVTMLVDRVGCLLG